MMPPDRIRPSMAFSAAALALLVAGCMTRAPAPVDDRTPFIAPEPPPPVAVMREPEVRPPQLYTVKRGETLAQIALDHGLDYRELAMWNNIENPNVIRVGQVLALSAPGQPGPSAGAVPGGVVVTPLVATPSISPSSETRALMITPGHGNTPTLKSEPRAMKLAYSDQAVAQLEHASPPSPVATPARPAPATTNAPPATATGPGAATPPAVAPPPAATAPSANSSANVATAAPPSPRTESARVPEIDDAKVDWAWPTTGKVIAGFSESANLKGIDIGGKAGQPVLASAAGRVVYAGAGLRGYGKLVIVKHNNTYLSAYAHNREILVKEGQQVSKGQKIGEMGDTDADQVKLHFEIRRLGKPIDPAKFLPPA
jgi:lipoprotein NlpD